MIVLAPQLQLSLQLLIRVVPTEVSLHSLHNPFTRILRELLHIVEWEGHDTQGVVAEVRKEELRGGGGGGLKARKQNWIFEKACIGRLIGSEIAR